MKKNKKQIILLFFSVLLLVLSFYSFENRVLFYNMNDKGFAEFGESLNSNSEFLIWSRDDFPLSLNCGVFDNSCRIVENRIETNVGCNLFELTEEDGADVTLQTGEIYTSDIPVTADVVYHRWDNSYRAIIRLHNNFYIGGVFENILTHETMHVLGISHSDNIDDVMYGVAHDPDPYFYERDLLLLNLLYCGEENEL